MNRRLRLVSGVTTLALVLASCGGGGGSTSPAANPPQPQTPASVFTPPAQEALTVAEVERIIAQAVAEARARNLPSTIAVVDRVGNVLAVFNMTGARARAQANPGPGGNFDVQAVDFPASMGAIAKAITGAYLSSSGNAFSTRTASFIIQQHFPLSPNTVGLESGPLFGVQFSSLPCSDLNTRFAAAGGATALIGPKRSPLGLSADPGGLPIYKNGVVVGGVGIMGDGRYGDDPNVLDIDDDAEEYIALAGTVGFDAPETIRANRISIDGTTLRYVDATPDRFSSQPASAPPFASINGSQGSLIRVRGYFGETGTPTILAGTAYGSEASGVRRASASEFSYTDAYLLSDGSGSNRYPPRAGTDAGDITQPLTAAETRALLEEAFLIMSRARAAIRQPQDSRAQVTISVVDTRGAILGIVRGPDAPLFGTDVSLQKARTATFFSAPFAGSELLQHPLADVQDRVRQVRTFLNDPAALTGKTAFSDRANGNLSRPYFPDGQVGTAPGPFSRPISEFNPFATGLQSALIVTNLAEHIFFVQNSGAGGGGAINNDTPRRCTRMPDVAGTGTNRLANGIQIFPGSVPIYRGNTLIGGIGISGDGIDQDDMISFLGLANAGRRLGGFGHAAPEMRADRIVIPVNGTDVRLRYVSCPFAPFVDTSEQNVCQGI
ncbi:heme-binding protein [Sphingomonas sp. 1P06PA]|uniref:heme-binding protein n=1 Tax=Sphingomonas sp. 1P06PA TaxID=554121 RepID=UPI0039A7662E